MTRSEIKSWAKEKVKGKRCDILPAIFIAGVIINFSLSFGGGNERQFYYIGWLFFFVEVGLAYFMIKFINDQPHEVADIFHFKDKFANYLAIGLLRNIFIFLWFLLFIIPGIMKYFSYQLVPLLLTDDKYKDMSATDLLKKSEEIMKGHRFDYFLLMLSFIGWHILALFTFLLLELWIAPYLTTAKYKFLYTVLNDYEGNTGGADNSSVNSSNVETNQVVSQVSTCSNCGAQVVDGDAFCTNCGQKIQ